jgi:enamine deaminase RidA (YjgF/YER057c/UK114 family)
MNETLSGRLAELGITLPTAPSPAANYVPYVMTGNLVYISGQLPMQDGVVQHTGCAGENATIEDGYAAARLCVINVVAQLAAAVGDRFPHVKQCVNITVFVNATAAFADQPKIANGASDLLVEIFGDAGRHSRAAVGVGSLPRGALTEVQAVFEIER